MVKGTNSLPDINALVAGNLKKVLAGRKPEAYCKEAGRNLVYVSGTKKGKLVAPRALRYAIDNEQAPRLDLIAAVAAKERLHPYQLLFSEFDPANAPVMISKAQEEWLRNVQESAKALPLSPAQRSQ